MKLAAARAIASVIPASDLGPEYIVPSVFNRHVSPAVAEAVAKAAIASGVRPPRPPPKAGTALPSRRGRSDSRPRRRR